MRLASHVIRAVFGSKLRNGRFAQNFTQIEILSVTHAAGQLVPPFAFKAKPFWNSVTPDETSACVQRTHCAYNEIDLPWRLTRVLTEA